MADALSEAKQGIIGGLNVINLVWIFVIILIVLIVLGLLTWLGFWIAGRLKYSKKVILFRKINGRFQVSLDDRAYPMPIGDSGDKIWIWKKGLITISSSMASGRDIYWFFEREDGELIPFTMGDIDVQMMEADAFFVHTDMRYNRTAINKAMRERLEKKESWWAKNATMVVTIAVIIILLIFMYFIVCKQIDGLNVNKATTEAQLKILEKLESLLGRMDLVDKGGSGLKPAVT